ncbi:MAG: hypothetical protein H7Z18_11865 [Methylophilaceae bacterium]|nr:hypothetical protein [Methylophilaceae bacterium]
MACRGPKETHAFIGYTAFLTARSDIMDYTPIPEILLLRQ